MTRATPLARLLTALLAMLALAACMAPGGPEPGTRDDVAALTRGIQALGEGIDPEEAARAARIAYDYSHRLAIEYQITDPPLIHNTKVNMGIKPRGLCWHWAEDMETRLKAEGFETLVLHRAIANADNPFRIDHSTAIVSRRGDTMFQGMVLDPWRKGGRLTWVPVTEDGDYRWVPQAEVLEKRRIERLADQGLAPDGSPL